MEEQAVNVSVKNTSAPKIDLIWNLTLICPWDCSICCVDAVHVKAQNGLVQIRSRALTTVEHVAKADHGDSIFDQAAKQRQAQKLELNLEGKLRVLRHLKGFDPKIDISGGDVLIVRENFTVLEEAARQFGREQVTLTATGAGLSHYDVKTIAPLIGEFNFTYDNVAVYSNRPRGYANGNLRKAAEFARAQVKTRAECPLTTENLSATTLRKLYLDLHEAGIDKLLLMRMFPVGRGMFDPSAVPTPGQYKRAIAILREMESQWGTPKLKLQCALKFFDSQTMNENPCDLVRESFGLMADGTLLASPWAVGPTGQPLHESWVLGNLAETQLSEILKSDKAREYQRRLNENFGHCKIHAYLNSTREDHLSRIFDEADPLYTAPSGKASDLELSLAP